MTNSENFHNPNHSHRESSFYAGAPNPNYSNLEGFTHYIDQEQIMKNGPAGDDVKAICGAVWAPNSARNDFVMCPDCQDVLIKRAVRRAEVLEQLYILDHPTTEK